LGYRYFRNRTFNSAIEKEAFVSVVSKATRAAGNRFGINTMYYVSFAFPTGIRQNFSVDIDTYNTLTEHDVGILTYKQYDEDLFFIDFEIQS